MNKYFRIFPGMIGLIFDIILLGIGIIKDINKVKIEESCDKITATLSNVTDVERHKNMSSDLDNYNYIQSYAINYMYNNLLYSVSENDYDAPSTGYQNGDTIQIYVEKENPTQIYRVSTIKNGLSFKIMAICAGGMGIIYLIRGKSYKSQ